MMRTDVRSPTGPCSTDHRCTNVVGLRILLWQLPVPSDPLDLQLLGGWSELQKRVAVVWLLCPASFAVLSGDRKGYPHGPIVLSATDLRQHRWGVLLRHKVRALVGPPVPELLLVAPPVHLQRRGGPQRELVRHPGLEVWRRLQHLPQDAVEPHGRDRHHSSGARAVAELEHHQLLAAHAQLLHNARGQTRVVDARAADLPGNKVPEAVHLHEVVRELLVRGDHRVLAGVGPLVELVLRLEALRDLGPSVRESGRPPIPRLQDLDPLVNRLRGIILEVDDAPECRGDLRPVILVVGLLYIYALPVLLHLGGYQRQKLHASKGEDPAVVVILRRGVAGQSGEAGADERYDELAASKAVLHGLRELIGHPLTDGQQGGLSDHLAKRSHLLPGRLSRKLEQVLLLVEKYVEVGPWQLHLPTHDKGPLHRADPGGLPLGRLLWARMEASEVVTQQPDITRLAVKEVHIRQGIQFGKADLNFVRGTKDKDDQRPLGGSTPAAGKSLHHEQAVSQAPRPRPKAPLAWRKGTVVGQLFVVAIPQFLFLLVGEKSWRLGWPRLWRCWTRTFRDVICQDQLLRHPLVVIQTHERLRLCGPPHGLVLRCEL
mmetsp:Transcript_94691/g.276917  ORF Transcript_94691/g.276917 Transcript_94691/m.276917 type:complete len:601 (+) Transcript_94691:953-2755(+)